MKARRLCVVLFVSAGFTLAAASLMIVWSTVGRGTVRNREGHTAAFHVEASKKHHRDATHVRGLFVLEFPATNSSTPGERLKIEVTEYAQEGNSSLVAGPAVFRRVTATGVHEIHGRGRARFVSRRHPDEPGDPDAVECSFTVPDGKFQFSFGGHVITGDVTIAKTESY